MSAIEEFSQAALYRSIGDICETVNTVLDSDELLKASLEKIIALFGTNRGSIFILESNKNELRLHTAIGLKSDEKQNMVKVMGRGIVGRVAQSKQPIFVSDIANDERFENFKARTKYQTPSFICAPLMLKDELIGVINITDKISGNRFKEEEMQLLDFLASQIALNYRRIDLYVKFRKIVKEQKTLKDRLGKTGQEREHLKRQIHIQEKLATIGKLAGGIAHEFNNPLDGVMRYTNLCLEQTSEDDVIRGYLMEIRQGLKRMANIVKSLLACSRNDVLHKEKIEFKKMIDRCRSTFEHDLSFRSIELEVSVTEDLPLIIDLGIERIIGNLIRNAIDAIDKDGKIALTAHMDNEYFILGVRDTGGGIPEEEVDKVFEPFFTTKDMEKGCGLGLTIVGEVVKAYDGEVTVESRLNHGTEFKVRLPIEKVL